MKRPTFDADKILVDTKYLHNQISTTIKPEMEIKLLILNAIPPPIELTFNTLEISKN